jgi:hypothetical protein
MYDTTSVNVIQVGMVPIVVYHCVQEIVLGMAYALLLTLANVLMAIVEIPAKLIADVIAEGYVTHQPHQHSNVMQVTNLLEKHVSTTVHVQTSIKHALDQMNVLVYHHAYMEPV